MTASRSLMPQATFFWRNPNIVLVLYILYIYIPYPIIVTSHDIPFVFPLVCRLHHRHCPASVQHCSSCRNLCRRSRALILQKKGLGFIPSPNTPLWHLYIYMMYVYIYMIYIYMICIYICIYIWYIYIYDMYIYICICMCVVYVYILSQISVNPLHAPWFLGLCVNCRGRGLLRD